MGRYQDVTIATDFMFVNGIPLFVSVSTDIKFITCENTKDQKSKTIIECIQKVKSLHSWRRFRFTSLNMDMEFKHLWGEFTDMGIHMNTVSQN